MKIAVPLTETGEFSPHYGAAAKFAVYDADRTGGPARRGAVITPDEPEPCGWAPSLRSAGVEVLLAGGIGRGAMERMTALGVTVAAGMPVMDPGHLVAAYLAGKLSPGANGCQGHGNGHGCHGHAEGGGPCRGNARS